jgi:hypothetical protein
MLRHVLAPLEGETYLNETKQLHEGKLEGRVQSVLTPTKRTTRATLDKVPTVVAGYQFPVDRDILDCGA